MNYLLLIGGNYLIYFLPIFFLFLSYRKSKLGKRREIVRDSLVLIFSLFISLFITILIRTLYPVDRPFVVNGIKPLIPFVPEPGFPSQHATIGFSFVSFFATQSHRWTLLSLIVTLLVSLSRVLAYLHSVADIVGGALIATVVFYLVDRSFSKILRRFAANR